MTTRYYYWIAAHDESGKPYLISAAMCKTESEARQRGMEMLGGLDFEIKRYPTRNLAMASAFHRGVRLEKTSSLSKASKRIGHDRSINQLKKRRRSLYD